MATFSFSAGDFEIAATIEAPPAAHAHWVEHAVLHDVFDLEGEGTLMIVAARRGRRATPQLVVSQRFSPGPEAGFQPGALLVAESALLFIGGGTRILAYDLVETRRVWIDEADTGFWDWRRHGDLVVMAAELELAAWDLHGRKLWSTFVEPPWEYDVVEGEVHLDVMGNRSRFAASTGPTVKGRA